MKYLRMLGLLAVAAAALPAFAGTAAAASVTSSEGSTPNIQMTSSNIELHGNSITIKCNHTLLEGNVESHGAGVPAAGAVDVLSFSGCNYQVTVNNRGSLAFHGAGTTGDGTVTSTGASITAHSSVGSCTFTTNGTDIGTLDGGSPAVVNINTATLHRTAGNFLCGTYGKLTGNFSVTSPSTLEIH